MVGFCLLFFDFFLLSHSLFPNAALRNIDERSSSMGVVRIFLQMHSPVVRKDLARSLK